MPEQTRDIKPCPGCGKPIRKRSKLCAQCYGWQHAGATRQALTLRRRQAQR